jgi:hypothetical protein
MRIKQRAVPFFLICLCLTIFSCSSSKEVSLRRYERFINKIQSNYANFSKKDWKKAEKRMKYYNNMLLKRYKNELTQEERNYISQTMNAYNSYREGGLLAANEFDDFIKSKDTGLDIESIIKNQKELVKELDELKRKSLEANRSQGKSEQERLIEKMQNDLLMEMLVSKKHGRHEISGKVKILIVPANYNGSVFRMDYNNLTPKIQEAVNLILSQARKYNQNISINWDYGSNISVSNSIDMLKYYSQYKNNYANYNHFVLVYAVDKVDRSFYRYTYEGSMGNITTGAVVWFKDSNGHSAGVLAHEIFHAFGAEDLYYEQGVVPKEVETNFKTLLGNSIMITSDGSSGLDPINAWLMGWNKNPEPWYAWFIDKRDNTVNDLNLTNHLRK